MGELTELARFDAHLFLAAMSHAGDGDVRYYINGVKLESPASGGLLLIATDGHRLLVIHDEKGKLTSPHKLIIPRVKLPGLKPLRSIDVGVGERQVIQILADPSMTFPNVVLRLLDEFGQWIWCARITVIEGRYPSWRNVVPLKSEIADLKPGTYDVRYMAALGAVQKAFGVRDYFTIYARGNASAIVVWEKCRAVAVLMPIRDDYKKDRTHDRSNAPAWLTENVDESFAPPSAE